MRMRLWLASCLAMAAAVSYGQTGDASKGEAIFQTCRHCHNVLTGARKAGPSLRTLFGKVRLVNGKRTTEQNVLQLISEGYNGMPSYRYLLRPDEWGDLIAFLKTLRARPEIAPVLKVVRGSDEEVLAAGKKHFTEHCAACHATLKKTIEEETAVPLIREGHGGMAAKKGVLTDADLFALLSFLKAQ